VQQSGSARLIAHLGWRANGDGFDVALAVNRLLALGRRAWWLAQKRDAAEAGDYLVEVSPEQHDALSRVGLALEPWPAKIPDDASPLARPAVRLFAGSASKYPYFAYYALCLLRLGIDYLPCDGPSLAQGALDDANLLILPGGFATWGIDAAEDAPGADARVRAFLANGGAAIGSCGGAFYLSAGRPGWTATANAKPLYTHEYLQSGVAIVSIALREGPLARGCPPTIEVPYYHGPIYDLLGQGIDVAATFHAFALPGRLAIDNPLGGELFEREMKGKPAILLTHGARGRAVLFSPHPEMGDLIRKYIALDGYVRHYLPIRGAQTMRDTLRHYRVTDAPSFRLVLNAAHALLSDDGSRAAANAEATSVADSTLGIEPVHTCRTALDSLRDVASVEEADLLRGVAAGIDARLENISPRLAAALAAPHSLDSLAPSWRHLSTTIAQHEVPANASVAQRLMEADLVVSLIECWTRVAETDRALAAR
jgi:CobB/CobQ-like glutamine amidotransferase domain